MESAASGKKLEFKKLDEVAAGEAQIRTLGQAIERLAEHLIPRAQIASLREEAHALEAKARSLERIAQERAEKVLEQLRGAVSEEMVLPVDMSKGVAGALLARAAGLKRLAVQVSDNADRIERAYHQDRRLVAHERYQALLEGSTGIGGEPAGVRLAGGCGRVGSGRSDCGEGGAVVAGEIAPGGERRGAGCSAGERDSWRVRSGSAIERRREGVAVVESRRYSLGSRRLGDAGLEAVAEAADAAEEGSTVGRFDLLAQTQDVDVDRAIGHGAVMAPHGIE